MKNIAFLTGLLFLVSFAFAQQKPQPGPTESRLDPQEIKVLSAGPTIPKGNISLQNNIDFTNFSNSLQIPVAVKGQAGLKVSRDRDSSLPIAIRGKANSEKLQAAKTPLEKSYAYLEAVKEVIQIQNPITEFSLSKEKQNTNGDIHLRMQQVFHGIPVYGSELIVHLQKGEPEFLNGRYFPTPQLENLNPALSDTKVVDLLKTDISSIATLKELTEKDLALLPEGGQFQAKLIIYHKDAKLNGEVLAWHISAYPNITQRWEYFIDAHTGEILHRFQSSCQIFHHGNFEHNSTLHAQCEKKSYPSCTTKQNQTKSNSELISGPQTADEIDLQGVLRTINVYETGGTFYLIDAARDMHNSNLSNFPDQAAGVVWTLDAFDTSPANSNFAYDQIEDNNNSWDYPNAVSAHFNGGEAYSYFEDVHGRSSINDEGGNIVSLINVADENGQDMDNAFWNGAAMFYGNGKQAFSSPLAKATDVAGHEMSHGVIQATANLTYQNQSGALNESFADIFGAMIDREDWQIGEEVINGNVFPSGAMRDMQDPHNGGNSNDFYWQPKHMNEFVQLPNTPQGDFGGVHINSGIPNHAYYLLATDIGKGKAEKIYYKALDDYLVASSQFIDCRIAVIKAAEDIHGNGSPEAAAAASAFDQVGIFDGDGGEYEVDVPQNPGQDVILLSDKSNIDFYIPASQTIDEASTTNQISKPSISDDGALIVFCDDQKRIVVLEKDWSTGMEEEYFFEGDNPQTIWRNVAISKDGSKLAVLFEGANGEKENIIYVYDDFSGQTVPFELYNPTYSTGVSTGDVKFADVMEWDHTGEYVMYDAFNELTSASGDDISYWDIGVIRVWDNSANDFSDGVVTKLFSGLQENESVGNPTFSKNSPYIIAFDLIQSDLFDNREYTVHGANIQTGEIGTIWENSKLGYPSYSTDDNEILFSARSQNNEDIIGFRDLAADKISGSGYPSGSFTGALWAVWFANGERDLVSVEETFRDLSFNLFPNPFNEHLQLEFQSEQSGEAVVEVLDLLGKSIAKKVMDIRKGHNQQQLDLSNVLPGSYTIHLRIDGISRARQLVKF